MQLYAESITLKERYFLSGNCITPALLGISPNENCLYPIDPDRERITLPAYALIKKLESAGFHSVRAESGTILFERESRHPFPKIEAAIRSRYLRRYPTLEITNVTLSPTGSLKHRSVSTEDCTLRLPETNLKKNRGTAILICGHRHYFLKYALTATLSVYKARHQIKKDRIIASKDVTRERVAFRRFTQMPLTRFQNGLVTRRTIRKGETIGEKMVTTLPDVRKNGRVQAFFREGSVTVEFDATALQNGNLGDMVTIRRDDGKTLRAVVTGKGEVEIR